MVAVGELSDRARRVFQLVVEHYLAHGEPVGSRTLSVNGGLNLSPASIRNVLQDLEVAGLLAAPHHSAGRVPTEPGLRLFVDGMMQANEPSDDERAAIERGLAQPGPIEEALSAATQALSGLSQCAGIISMPGREVRLREFAFAMLSRGKAMAILVADDGTVENRVFDVAPDIGASQLAEAGAFMTARFAGLTLAEARRRMSSEVQSAQAALDAAAGRLIADGLALWSLDQQERRVLIVRGQAHLLAEGAGDVERVRQLLDELEVQERIATLLDAARHADAAKVFIGAENKLFALSGSSVVASPWRGRDGRVVGVVGVIGPTRLNYARVVPIVDFTAKTLTRLLA